MFVGKTKEVVDDKLVWTWSELEKTILLKTVGRLGGEPERGDVQEIRCLNRVLRWQLTGIAMEADPRHAELLVAALGPTATSLSTPGARTQGHGGRCTWRPGKWIRD